MEPTERQIVLLNKLIEESIDHGGDAGGPYFCNKESVIDAMIEYRNDMFGKESGILIADDQGHYPYFIFDSSSIEVEE